MFPKLPMSVGCIPWSRLAGHQHNSFPLWTPARLPFPGSLTVGLGHGTDLKPVGVSGSEGHHSQAWPIEPLVNLSWNSLYTLSILWLNVNAWDDLENLVLKRRKPGSLSDLWPESFCQTRIPWTISECTHTNRNVTNKTKSKQTTRNTSMLEPLYVSESVCCCR